MFCIYDLKYKNNKLHIFLIHSANMYKIFHNAQTQVPRRFLTQYMIVVDRYVFKRSSRGQKFLLRRRTKRIVVPAHNDDSSVPRCGTGCLVVVFCAGC